MKKEKQNLKSIFTITAHLVCVTGAHSLSPQPFQGLIMKLEKDEEHEL